MSLWRRIGRGFRAWSRRETVEREIADEVRFYFDEAVAAGKASGLTDAEARRRARLDLGDELTVREDVRTFGWENTVDTFLTDLRYSLRRLRGSPGFTVVGVLTLAFGIGASTVIFSAAHPILFAPLPYPDPDELVMIWDRGADGTRLDVTYGSYRELAERSRTLDGLAVWKAWQPTLTDREQPERLEGQRVSASYFRVLGVRPALGRDFDVADDRPNAGAVAILGDALWRRRFGADSAIVGRAVTLDENTFTVVGVMASDFENVLSAAAELWTPLQYDAALPVDGREWGHHLRLVARVRPGVGQTEAAHELDRIARAPIAEFARPQWAALDNGLLVKPLQQDMTEGVKGALAAVLGAVGLLLTMAAVNVANLLLARGANRAGEFALRTALGAGRTRMIRQLVTESLLLAALGGAVGLLLTVLGTRALVALSPPGLPRLSAIRVDTAVLIFGIAVSAVVGLVVGLLPALRAGHADLHGSLRQSSRRTAGRRQRTRHVLVIAEIAIAIVLMANAGLLFRSLQRLFAIDPGFDAERVLTMQVHTSGRRFDTDGVTQAYFARVLEEVRRVPGVSAAGFTSQLPLSGDFDQYGVQVESRLQEGVARDAAFRYAVTPGYLETMRIPLKRGRLLDNRDAGTAPGAVLINESFARRIFHDRDPLGERLHVGRTDVPWFTIIGVVGDVKQATLGAAYPDAVYLPAAQWYAPDRVMTLVIRSSTDLPTLVLAVRNAIWSVDKDQPIARVATMSDLLEQSAGERRFASLLFNAFAIAALTLAAIGIYGLLSGSVTERKREIGVRSALGATRASILRLVFGEAVSLTAAGVVIGLAAALVASRGIAALLFGVSRLDPVTYMAAIALLAGVSLMASSMPAIQAARTQPSVALSAD